MIRNYLKIAFRNISRHKFISFINIGLTIGLTSCLLIISTIVTLLSKDFLKLVLIAAIIVFPVSWFAMNKWLQDFAYRTTFQWWIFLLAFTIAAPLAFFTISFQAIKAAITNPVKSLRTA